MRGPESIGSQRPNIDLAQMRAQQRNVCKSRETDLSEPMPLTLTRTDIRIETRGGRRQHVRHIHYAASSDCGVRRVNRVGLLLQQGRHAFLFKPSAEFCVSLMVGREIGAQDDRWGIIAENDKRPSCPAGQPEDFYPCGPAPPAWCFHTAASNQSFYYRLSSEHISSFSARSRISMNESKRGQVG